MHHAIDRWLQTIVLCLIPFSMFADVAILDAQERAWSTQIRFQMTLFIQVVMHSKGAEVQREAADTELLSLMRKEKGTCKFWNETVS